MRETKTCGKCEIEKCLNEFYNSKKYSKGVEWCCKECKNSYNKMLRDTGRMNKVDDWYRVTDRGILCKDCELILPKSKFYSASDTRSGYQYKCKRCKERYRLQPSRMKRRKRLAKLERNGVKLEVLSHYSSGELICNCCGESEFEFLSIHHEIDVPKSEYKDNGDRLTGVALMRRLRRSGYPNGYSVLCLNCNCAHGFYGICPHKNPNYNPDWIPPVSKRDIRKILDWTSEGRTKREYVRIYGRERAAAKRAGFDNYSRQAVVDMFPEEDNLDIKFKVLNNYSAGDRPICGCCGETIIHLLTIDHLGGRGEEDLSRKQGGATLYRHLRVKNYPGGYETVCMNCNYSRRENDGKCIHELE